MKTAAVTNYVHSRGFAGLMLALSLAGVIAVYVSGNYALITGDKSFVLPSANEWISLRLPDFAASLAANILVVVTAGLIAKFFNVLRSSTSLPLALFGAFQLATPGLSAQFYTGSVLAVLVSGCLMLLFSCYRAHMRTRRIFLIFLLLSAACATQYCYALYIPVFLLGCGQMRVFNGRTAVAALLGIVTPWWLMGAAGMLSAGTLRVPQFVSIFQTINSGTAAHLLVTVGLTALLLVGCFVMNVMKTIAYNARSRAYSGAFATLSLATLLGMVLDFRNLISYIPLLNFCAAYEVAGYFSSHRGERTGISVVCIVLIYIVLYICQILI